MDKKIVVIGLAATIAGVLWASKAKAAPKLPFIVKTVSPNEAIALLDKPIANDLNRGIAELEALGQDYTLTRIDMAIALLPASGIGNVIYPTPGATSESLQAAVNYVNATTRTYTTDPVTGLATPIVSTVVQTPAYVELINQGANPQSYEWIKTYIESQWPPEWRDPSWRKSHGVELDLDLEPRPTWVQDPARGAQIGYANLPWSLQPYVVGWPKAYQYAHGLAPIPS